MNWLDKITELYQEGRELILLEWTYAIISICSLLLAGLFALVSQPLGIGLLIIPLVSFIAFTMNIVAWALIKLIIESVHPEFKPVTAVSVKANRTKRQKSVSSPSSKKRQSKSK